MALNFSHRPIFSSHISEENLVSPLRIANGYLVDGITNRCHEKDDCFDYGRRERGGERSVPPESCSKDVVDLLPSDPFGMDISTTFTAITGWLEDLEADCRGGYEFVNRGNSMGEYDLFAGFNFFWNSAVQFQAFSSNFHFGEKSGVTTETKVERKAVTKSASCGAEGGEPHEALAFSLSFLGIRDLLSVEMVCKSLHSTVQGDPLLWRKIHIDQPLNDKISDDVLSRLATRAQGSLQSLSLVDCPRITDDSLREILESNPRLTKLSVPGCTRISIEGIVNNLKLFNSKNTPGIKHLRIGGLYGITEDHFEELKLLLGVDVHFQKKEGKPLFYHKGNLYLPCDDNRAIDIETCLKCQKLRLVYDCSSEGCRKKRDTLEACRACRLCIPRCVQCGCCIDDTEYEETFCLDWLCSDCSRQLVCSDGQDGNDDGGFEIGVIYEQVFNSIHG